MVHKTTPNPAGFQKLLLQVAEIAIESKASRYQLAMTLYVPYLVADSYSREWSRAGEHALQIN